MSGPAAIRRTAMEPCSSQILCAEKGIRGVWARHYCRARQGRIGKSQGRGQEAWPLSGERRQGSGSWSLFGSGFGLIKTAKTCGVGVSVVQRVKAAPLPRDQQVEVGSGFFSAQPCARRLARAVFHERVWRGVSI